MPKSQTLAVFEVCRQAKEYEEAGDYASARQVLAPLWAEREALAGIERAEVFMRVGTISSRTGTQVDAGEVHETAKNLLTESLRLFEAAGEFRQAAEAGIGLALCCKQDGTFDEARVWLDHIEGLLPGGDDLLKCRTLLMRAIVEKDDGRPGAALELHKRISHLLPGIHNHTLLGKCHGEYGIALKQLGIAEEREDYKDAALLEYTEADYHHEQAGDVRSCAMVKNNIANLLLVMGQPRDALRHVDEAIRVVERLKDRIQIATFEETRAQVLLALNQPGPAEASARRSVVMLRIGGERALLVESLVTHGRALMRLGELGKAREAFTSGVDVALFVGFRAGELSARMAILEEDSGLDVGARWAHHSRCFELLAGSRDTTLLHRHAACLMVTTQTMASHLSPEREESPPPFPWENFSLGEAVYGFEEFCITLAIGAAGGCQTRAAKFLKVSDGNLYAKLKDKFRHLKALLKKGHYRTKEHDPDRSTIALVEIDDESMSDFGIMPGDLVVYRCPGLAREGDPVVLGSKGIIYVGVYTKAERGIILEAACEGFESWEFPEGTYHVEGKIVGFIRHDARETVLPLELSDRQRAS